MSKLWIETDVDGNYKVNLFKTVELTRQIFNIILDNNTFGIFSDFNYFSDVNRASFTPETKIKSIKEGVGVTIELDEMFSIDCNLEFDHKKNDYVFYILVAKTIYEEDEDGNNYFDYDNILNRYDFNISIGRDEEINIIETFKLKYSESDANIKIDAVIFIEDDYNEVEHLEIYESEIKDELI